MNKNRLVTIYNIVIPILAAIVLMNVVLAKEGTLSEAEINVVKAIDWAIWVVFVIDYFVRLYLSDNRRKFITGNPIDLISIIPFGAFMPGLRTLRILRVVYLLRVVSRFSNSLKQFSTLALKNDFHYLFILTIMLMTIGTVIISRFENMSLEDALWWSFVTITTVGYGDLSPKSGEGRIVAVVLMFIGIGLISALTANVASFLLRHKNKKSFAGETVNQIITDLGKFESLSINDIDAMYSVLIALKRNAQQENKSEEIQHYLQEKS
ncbi:MAG: potassium channel family protein [Negativicutes bacterium]|jgi:voltage-gated potassium channel